MKKNYLKQAWMSMRQQPVISMVSVIGTALAIFLIMIVVMMQEIDVAPFAPESNRDRWLVQRFGSIANINWIGDDSNNGPLGYKTVKAVFYEMKIPEAVTAFDVIPIVSSVAIPGQPAFGTEVLGVDNGFWNVMDFSFIDGKPFTKADFESAIPVAVISESTARKLFGTINATGRGFTINHAQYRVCGVVKDVTNLAKFSYANIWVPFTSTNTLKFGWCDDYMGFLSVIILAKDPVDFPTIREEYNQLFAKFGDEVKINGWKFISRNRPYTQEQDACSTSPTREPDMDAARRTRFITYLILLIVPAINLSNMTHSRLQRRREEIGVQRAFGATRTSIITDIFVENLVITFIAGLIGLALSLIFALGWGGLIFSSGFGSASQALTGISLDVVFHWSTFAWAMLFCFILNLFSAGLPSLQASRVNIVNAISGKN